MVMFSEQVPSCTDNRATDARTRRRQVVNVLADALLLLLLRAREPRSPKAAENVTP
jgi:hypothetical protein